uniref:Uncharacterized protein n=1 Tax=Anguilla anguilla TaxID=7936 RepID=A0A0E9QCN4_ANGAN
MQSISARSVGRRCTIKKRSLPALGSVGYFPLAFSTHVSLVTVIHSVVRRPGQESLRKFWDMNGSSR